MDMEREKRAEKIKFQFCCIVIFLLVLGCMLFLGCTATPKENEEKDLNILSEKQERDTGEDGEGETLLMQKLNVPEKLETEKKSKDGKKTLLINAAVEVPKTAAIPLRDIEPRAYKEKEVDEIIKKLFPGELKSEEKAGQGDEDRAILIDVNGEVETGDKTNVIFAAEDVYTTTVSLKAYNGEKYFLDLYDYAKVSKSQSESLFFPHAVLLLPRPGPRGWRSWGGGWCGSSPPPR